MKKFYLLFFLFGVSTLSWSQTNTVLGVDAGSAGSSNTSIGYKTGDVVTGNYNSFLGAHAGAANTTGNGNSFFGYTSGYKNTLGSNNTFTGYASGQFNISGSQNVFSGYYAGFYNSTGVNNVMIGSTAGYSNLSGSHNVFLGKLSGYSVVSGNNNVFLGNYSGYYETGSDKLYIDNSDTTTPLIYGNFSSNQVGINSLTTSTNALSVGGTSYFSNNVGIGITNPGATLDIVKSGGPTLRVYSPSAPSSAIIETNAAGTVRGIMESTISPDVRIRFGSRSNNIVSLMTNNINRVNIATDGKVGIGIVPDATLHVAGNVKIADGTQGSGKVLTSDANGLASWAAFSSGGWSLTGNAGIIDGTNFIGTTDGSVLNFKVGNDWAGRIDQHEENTFFGYYSGATLSALAGLGTPASGFRNTFVGAYAGMNNTDGDQNAFFGDYAGTSNEVGSANTGIGSYALDHNIEGTGNTAVGLGSLLHITGSYNTGIGMAADQPGTGYSIDNSTVIGYNAKITASNQVRIGDSNITSIGGQVSWSTLSDGRFKRDIKKDVSGLSFIRQLNPVSYTVDKDAVDKFLRIPDSLRQKNSARTKPVRETGFVAQEVEAIVKKSGFVFAGVEAPQNENDHYSLRYSEFVVPLVKAVQELDEKTSRLEKLVEDQQKVIALLMGESAQQSNQLAGTALHQNHPNPSEGITEITMDISESVSNATIHIYSLSGTLLEKHTILNRGNNISLKVDGPTLGSGIFLYSLTADGKLVGVKRMLIVR